MSKKIIVAPLNWGLGHASRCVPIINALLSQNYIPVIASDGKSLEFLRQEFPDLETLQLPSYQISYGKNLKWDLIFQIPKILKSVKEETIIIDKFLQENKDVVGIISDNRFGIRSKKIRSIYITHQINVLSGFTTFFTSKFHQIIINKFDECWIPDEENGIFSGKLSSSKRTLNQKFIGVLSRFKKQDLKNNIDVLVLLSGPEPNRTFLEKKLTSEFKNDTRNIVFVLGKVENEQKNWVKENATFYNYLLTKELEVIINSSEIVVCRSGYSTIMDLAVLEKKVFFIPTKNQSEQEYLANYFKEKKIAPFSTEEDFTLSKLSEIKNYTGLKSKETFLHSDLFRSF